MKKRAMPRATAEALDGIKRRSEWAVSEHAAGRLSFEDASEYLRLLRDALALEVLRDSMRKPGRPKGQGKPRPGGGMLAHYMPPKPETRGRKRVWPAGFEMVTYRAVSERMERDGLGVSAAVRALLKHAARELGMREIRALKDEKNIRELYRKGRMKAAEAVTKKGGAD